MGGFGNFRSYFGRYAKIGGWIGAGLRGVRFVDPGAAAGFVMEGFTDPDLGEVRGGAAK